ncbi:MAG: GH92 family glycosyl hydrolase, partial [Sciscionella sp.]
PDNVVAAGQTVDLSGAQAGATQLAFLGSASNGEASGAVTVTYTDGSRQQADIGFTDWTRGGGGGALMFGNQIAASTPYRNETSGGSQRIDTYVFATAPIALQAGKRVASVTLPTEVKGGALHIFAITAA